MIAFIDDHRVAYGVEPVCKVLPIAPSTYHVHVAKRIDAGKRSARARRDAELKIEIERVFAENFGVYGARKVWRQLQREGFDVPRCTVERLMADLGLQGVVRGKPVRTTVSDKAAPCPLDHVNRQFHARRPNALWVSDFTYVATWSGFVYVAFVIDAYARRIVGWRVSRTAHAGFVLDALEQALHERRPVHGGGLVHPTTPSAWRKPGSSRPLAASATATTTPSDRGHPSTRTVAVLRGRRVRDIGMGGLVQQPAAPGAHRQHPAGRSRGALLRNARRAADSGVTQTKWPPANPGRFSLELGQALKAEAR